MQPKNCFSIKGDFLPFEPCLKTIGVPAWPDPIMMTSSFVMFFNRLSLKYMLLLKSYIKINFKKWGGNPLKKTELLLYLTQNYFIPCQQDFIVKTHACYAYQQF